MVEKIRATEAKAHLSALMARAGYGGERFVVERRGKPLAALVSVEDLERLEGEREDASSRPMGALALIGVLDEEDERELDSVLEEVYMERERDTGRPVDLGA